MSATPYNPTGDYLPETTVEVPPLYRRPWRPLAVLRYLVVDMMFPWNYLYIALALICWAWFTPSMAAMANFEFGWLDGLWLRNAAVLTLVDDDHLLSARLEGEPVRKKPA